MRILPVDNLHQRKNTVWTQKFLRNYTKYLFTKSCLKVYVFLNSCGRIDANKCRCKSCLQSILQLYLANILFHFLWFVGWIVTLSSIAALIVGTKYRNIPQTVIKSHKNVQIGNFQDSGQILAFSTKENKTDFHFVYYLPTSLKPIKKTLCLMAGVGGGEFFFRCEFLNSYFYHIIGKDGSRMIISFNWNSSLQVWMILLKFNLQLSRLLLLMRIDYSAYSFFKCDAVYIWIYLLFLFLIIFERRGMEWTLSLMGSHAEEHIFIFPCRLEKWTKKWK